MPSHLKLLKTANFEKRLWTDSVDQEREQDPTLARRDLALPTLTEKETGPMIATFKRTSFQK